METPANERGSQIHWKGCWAGRLSPVRSTSYKHTRASDRISQGLGLQGCVLEISPQTQIAGVRKNALRHRVRGLKKAFYFLEVAQAHPSSEVAGVQDKGRSALLP